jgi:hypothetical protein
VPPLDVAGTSPILVVGEGEQAQGEVWLSNSSGGPITMSSATISVTLPTGAESAAIQLPPDASVPANASRRLMIGLGLDPLTAPGAYAGSVALATSAGAQTIAATLVVAAVVLPLLVPARFVFAGVKAGATVSATVVVRNKGNVPIAVGPIPEEPLLELRAHPRAVGVSPLGVVAVEPALGLAPVGTVSFTNNKPTIAPGNWAAVDFKLKAPAALAKNAHLRALPRIANDRFSVDLLTVP